MDPDHLSPEDEAALAKFELGCEQDYYRQAEYDQEAQDELYRDDMRWGA